MRTGRKRARRRKCPPQREVLRDVMLSAGECATWLTLDELAHITRYPPAGISAQLRHLRKPRHGGFRLEKRGVCALNWKDAPPYLWRPDIRPRLNEWVADFALAEQSALHSPELASRMVMFRMFYLGMAPYETARHFLGLTEMSWSKWSEEAATLRQGITAPSNVSATQVFRQRDIELKKKLLWFREPARRRRGSVCLPPWKRHGY